MKSIIFTLLFTLSVTAAETPKLIVSKIFKLAAIKSIGTDKKGQEQINNYVDFESMASSALGAKKGVISNKDFKWFKNSLKEIITRSVYPEAPSFLKKVKISYSAVEQKGATGKVSSVVMSKGEPTDVDYFFAKKNGKWRIVDIALDMDSWVEGINEQVEESWEQEKWVGIKKKISKRLTELRKTK